MLDPTWFRQDLSLLAEKLGTRGLVLDEAFIQEKEAERKRLQTETQTLQQTRNTLSKTIAKLKAQGESAEAIEAIKNQVLDLSTRLEQQESALKTLQSALNDYLASLPNCPMDSVPVGASAEENVIDRTWGTPTTFDFVPQDHVSLGAKLGLDMEAGALLSGSRFAVLKGKLASLHRALSQFMLDTHLQAGYEECYVPYLVRSDCFFGTGQFPKFVEDQFGIENSDLWLIPTAEVPVTNLCREQILSESALPQKWVCHTPSFRREAGAYGKDMRGLTRVHQFDKVELVQIHPPTVDPDLVLQSLTQDAESILQALGLPYRVLNLCTGDLGFSAAKTWDLEVFLPGQNTYREISSCSFFGDFQARRLKARCRLPETGKTAYVYTFNGSGLAVGRSLIAIMENYQTQDGRIEIPAVLRPYMGGLTHIEPMI